MKAFTLQILLALLIGTTVRCAEVGTSAQTAMPARIIGPGHISDPLSPRLPGVFVQVTVDLSGVESAHPEVRAWSIIASNLCEQWYSAVCATLGENDVPHHVILRVIGGTGGHAEGNVITIGIEDISHHPSDYGSIIHELAHVIQNYRYGWFRNKGVGWLVEGIADYVRFYVYESDPDFGKIRPDKSRFDDGYRTTACFLDYIVRTYDPNFVKKVHRALREGRMSREVFDQMIANDGDVAVSRRKRRDEIFTDFVTEWQRIHSCPTSGNLPTN